MPLLDSEQHLRALQAFYEYLSAPANPDGRRPMDAQAELDGNRERLIEGELKPLVLNYLNGQVKLPEFKSKVDGLNKQNGYWGFKGIKGQMFFNILVNVSKDASECDRELKAVLAVPTSEEIARSRLTTFISYVGRMREQHIESGGSKQGAPKLGSIPFFVSYFWQIQDRTVWPIYYTNSVQMMASLNFWQPTTDLVEDYIAYKHLHEELVTLFSQDSHKPIDLYQVEHVFWWKGGNPFGGNKPLDETGPDEPEGAESLDHEGELTSVGDITTEFAKFRAEPYNRFVIHLRRKHAEQLRQFLSDPEKVTLESFNKEVWWIESSTRLGEEELKLYSTVPPDASRVAELHLALDENRLELHGNYIWGSASRTGHQLSYCVWTKDRVSLLPKTERIVLGGEGQAPIMAPWEEVVEIVGDMLTPMGIYPERYRVDAFPTAAQLAAMGNELKES